MPQNTPQTTILPDIVEICCPSPRSAREAILLGADRIELCTDIGRDGLTPGRDEIAEVHSLICGADRPPVLNVLIRPRDGDFTYTPAEKEEILREVEWCALSGIVDGVVVGALTPEGDVDVPFCEEVLSLAGRHALGTTFHRAVDHSRDILSSTGVIARLGFGRILSSGGMATAWEGRGVLRSMVEIVRETGSPLRIMAGAGVSGDNVLDIVRYTGVREVHGTRTGILAAAGRRGRQGQLSWSK